MLAAGCIRGGQGDFQVRRGTAPGVAVSSAWIAAGAEGRSHTFRPSGSSQWTRAATPGFFRPRGNARMRHRGRDRSQSFRQPHLGFRENTTTARAGRGRRAIGWSCDASAQGRTRPAKASRRIGAGEELTISAAWVSSPREECFSECTARGQKPGGERAPAQNSAPAQVT
jgi:hypothetical protein